MESPRQEYWSRLPFPPPGDIPDSEIEPASPVSPTLQVDSLSTEPLKKPNKCGINYKLHICLYTRLSDIDKRDEVAYRSLSREKIYLQITYKKENNMV